ncbi:MAG: right-handed parallel beta-helix repeat-containing protein, partial [Candidatus Cloacimonadota bacterium]|nr:right-handed parallel beta-helix repeat-containing protein [Candidatus Cloacimonadota bacterium]
LQNDDFLTIWTFDHGSIHDNHTWLCLMGSDEISDEAFGDLVNQINCQKKVIFMQQCFSGGFVPYLENQNSVVFTAANDHMSAFREDNLYFDGIDFPGDDDPGNEFSAYEEDIWANHEYRHGEYNLHLFNALKGETPDYNTYYVTDDQNFPISNCDMNNDEICSIFEASEWVKEYDSRQRYYYSPWSGENWDDPQWSDLGNIGETTSLEYPNLLSGQITQSQSISGIVAVNGNLTIGNNSTLSIESGTKLYLTNRNQLLIEEGSNLNIAANVVIFGESTTIPHDETNPVEIPGNRVEVYGCITIGNNVQFTANDGEHWDGLYIYSNDDVQIYNVEFKNCKLYNENGSLTIANSNFVNSSITVKNANIEISNSEIEGYVSCSNIGNNSTLSIIGNTNITGYGDGVKFSGDMDYYIENCNISNNSGNGINLNSCFGILSLISNCTISNNNSNGILLYASESTLQSCIISGNNRGVLAWRSSIVEILKNPASGSWTNDSVIANNDFDEVLFLDDCTMILDRNRNKITDNDNYYLINCPNSTHNRVFRYNYWGYQDQNGIALLPPENRLNPSVVNPNTGEVGYLLSPVWNPGTP